MTEKKYTWYQVGLSLEELQLPTDGISEVVVNGKPICITRFGDAVHACFAKCPHAGGKLVAGYLDTLGNIVCPLHRYKFSAANGRNISGEGYHLKTYPVEIRETGVFVGMEENKLFNW